MRDTLALIEEFLNESEAIHIRRNASTALGALSSDAAEDHRDRTKASMERLALIAVSDPSKEVRDHAAEVLHRAAVDNPKPKVVEAAVQVLNATREPEVRRRAYALLGRLRADGVTGAPQGVAASLRRLGLAASIKCLPDVEVKPTFQWRPAWWAAGSSLAGAFVLAPLALVCAPSADSAAVLVVGLLIIAPLLGASMGVFATQRATPIGLHYDRLAGGLAVIGRTITWTAPLACVAAFLVLDIVSPYHREWLVWLASALGLLLVVASVKFGSLLAYGVATRPRTALGVHASSGATCGLITSTTLAAFYPLLVHDSDWTKVIMSSWAILIPTMVGLGVAFADIERRSVPPRRVKSRVRTLVVVLALLLALCVCPFVYFYHTVLLTVLSS